MVEAWVLMNFKGSGAPCGNTACSSLIGLMRIDCAISASTFLNMHLFTKPGGKGEIVDTMVGDGAMERSLPGAVGYNVNALACA
jgi:hypothetical protein